MCVGLAPNAVLDVPNYSRQKSQGLNLLCSICIHTVPATCHVALAGEHLRVLPQNG